MAHQQRAQLPRPDKRSRVAKSPTASWTRRTAPSSPCGMNILTRKTLGGLETDLDAQVLRPDGSPMPGLYAAGEVAGFGGGGVHGYNALEGTFLGGCIFSGRAAGRALAKQAYQPRQTTPTKQADRS